MQLPAGASASAGFLLYERSTKLGFTRYWTRQRKNVPAKKWNAFTDDVQIIFKAHKGLISREYDLPDRAPIVDDTQVVFNGKGEAGHETCWINRDFEQQEWRGKKEPQYAFCKTARKPYDAVVAAVLSCLSHHIGDIYTVSSDGNEEDQIPPYETVAERYKLT